MDIRQDQADRFDNRIDVFGKTFLGLTVACARCHDHKFDAISTKDYYALFGFLEQQQLSPGALRLDGAEPRASPPSWRGCASASAAGVQRALAEALRPAVERMADYLLAAREAIRLDRTRSARQRGWSDRAGAASSTPAVLRRWVAAPARPRAKDARDPLHAWAKVAPTRRPKPQRLAELLRPLVDDCASAAADAAARRRRGGHRLRPLHARTTGCRTTSPSAPARCGPATCAWRRRGPARRAVRRARRRREGPRLGRAEAGARRGERSRAARRAWCAPAARSARRPSRVDAGKVYYLVKGGGHAYAAVGSHVLDRRAAARPAACCRSRPATDFRWVGPRPERLQGPSPPRRIHRRRAPTSPSRWSCRPTQPPGVAGPAQPGLLQLLLGDEAAVAGGTGRGYQRLFARRGEAAGGGPDPRRRRTRRITPGWPTGCCGTRSCSPPSDEAAGGRGAAVPGASRRSSLARIQPRIAAGAGDAGRQRRGRARLHPRLAQGARRGGAAPLPGSAGRARAAAPSRTAAAGWNWPGR